MLGRPLGFERRYTNQKNPGPSQTLTRVRRIGRHASSIGEKGQKAEASDSVAVGLALIQHRDHAPYCCYGDAPEPDPLLETAMRWGIDAEARIKAVTERAKPKQSQKAT